MSDSENASASYSGDKTPPKKKIKMWYSQSFNSEWLTNPEFKDWIKADPKDKNVVHCVVCDSKLKNPNKGGLMSHKTTSKHIKNCKSKKQSVKKPEDTNNKVHNAELLFSGFMAEHGMSFSQADHLIKVMKRMFPDCETVQKMTMKKTIRMQTKMLEVCVDSVASAIAAVEGGADRLELCAALSEGGLTPTLGLLAAVKKFISRPVDVFCMVRPRGGPMVYSKEEEEVILSDVNSLKMAGADGLVFGALNDDGTINKELCGTVKEAAGDLPCTFHRAFDLIPDPVVGLETVIALNYDRILTSGGKASALEGSDTLAQLVNASKGRIIIMAGAGVKSSNIAHILSETNVHECHASARVQRVFGSGTEIGPKMGQGNDSILWLTCSDEVRKIKQALAS